MIRKRKVNNVRIEPLELDKQDNKGDLMHKPDEMASNRKNSNKPGILRKSVSLQKEPIFRDELSPLSPISPGTFDYFITTGDASLKDTKNIRKRNNSSNSTMCKCGLSVGNKTHSIRMKSRGITNSRTGSRLKRSASFSNGYNPSVIYECAHCERNNLTEESTPGISTSSTSTPPIHKGNLRLELKVIMVAHHVVK